MPQKLKRGFYSRKTDRVAQELLGKVLVHRLDKNTVVSGRIVETEAYLGAIDPAAHSYPLRRTSRTEVMFGPGGFAYVYFIYGVHFCFNVVTQKEGIGEAVLIRALEPIDGISTMMKFRKTKKAEHLCSGPGKLCQALKIGRAQNAEDLTGSSLWIEDRPQIRREEIIVGPRIGIAQAEARHLPLRFCLKSSPHLSRPASQK